MSKEIRTVVYDDELRIEAYRFEGIVQPFPNHFHEYYVIGFMEKGERCLSCKNQEYVIKKGDIVLFNPGDNHSCVQLCSFSRFCGRDVSETTWACSGLSPARARPWRTSKKDAGFLPRPHYYLALSSLTFDTSFPISTFISAAPLASKASALY